jgi:hypothetical protein
VLLREEYIAGFTHGDQVVRNTALELVSRCKAGALDATRQALRALETYGLEETFLYNGNLTRLPLEDESAEKLFGLLLKLDHGKIPHLVFKWLVCEAPVGFLGEHRDAILEMEADLQTFLPISLAEKNLARRFRLARTPPSELLARLDLLPMECSKDMESFPHELVKEAESLIEALCAIPNFRGELESRANAWLALEVGKESPENVEGEPPALDNFWPASFGVRIAGCLSMGQTIPALVKLLALDADYMNEWVAEALEQMNSIHTLQAWGTLYPDLEWHERLFLGGTCSHISEPGVDAFIERLLETEEDSELVDRLMVSLSMQPTPRATARCAEFYLDNQENPEAHEIAENLYTRHILLGLDHPDLELWRGQCHERHVRFAKNLMQGDAFHLPARNSGGEPYLASPKTGRNDPCPCGSGKKYKKCCQSP